MEFRDDQAIYLQIADRFCENILLRKWNPLDRIPSVREVAVEIEVNPNTVMRTFTYLQEKGIIFNKRGIGYFVSEDGFEKTKVLRKENFVTNELPRFFKALELLNLSLTDINNYHQEYESSKSNMSNGELS
jgi:DNA-binding transcriptional regulator YhcF (GntR family)